MAGGDAVVIVQLPSTGVLPRMFTTSFLPDPEGWEADALCAQTDPEAFFPEKGGSTKAGKEICAMCEVTAKCLTYALEHDERFGIWGGLSERERRQMRNSRQGRA